MTNANGAIRNVNFIALWDGFAWERLGRGVNGAVTTIAPSFDLNRIFVGGEFNEATNFDLTRKPANYIAVYNRAYHPNFALEWDVFGSGVNGSVNIIVPLRPCPPGSASEVLPVGGRFNQAGNKNARGLAKWKYRATTPAPIGISLGIDDIGRSSRGSR